MNDSSRLGKVQLGSSNLFVSRLGLGCMGLNAFYRPFDGAGAHDEKESERFLRQALEMGMNFFDTSDFYAAGRNESLVGRALKPVREQAIIATKFGITWDEATQTRGISGRPEYVRQCCEDSLRRLGVDVIDLYYYHRIDPETPLEDTLGAMAELVKEGKVRQLGISEATGEQIRRAHAVHSIAAVQNEYSLWSREPEADALPACRELGVALVPYSPLGRGFLTGKIATGNALSEEDWRRNNPRFSDEAIEANKKFVDVLAAIAQRHNATAAQIALAWLLRQGEDIIPIPGSSRLSRLQENLAAATLQLDAEDVDLINAKLPMGSTAGSRY
ncbi:aldo/keto reductase [Hahella sp. KA22]|uniref:aldo/keto reductase n=1 Tax=Hahella sp. KA22 TaxID=1628392 RepID=UPI000FDE9EB2|nr:aldo/keto reductase [Hahella sp. KA22]AZZ91990.1 aldo/keto reductase [Hahella sp. KA22]QAY55361.1 aldo/keto reductase [Hahella sp. KA22]